MPGVSSERKMPVQVFVGYSYGLYPASDFRQIFANVSSKLGVEFVFADTRVSSEHILDKITRMIHEADLALFDISDWNPNVTLELGIARESGKPWYILLDPSKSTGGIREAPADLRGFDRIQYSSLDELQEGLIRLLSQDVPPPTKPAIQRSDSGYVVLCDTVVDIESTEHEALPIDVPQGARLAVFARELWKQPFDLYVMDRRNYARFCRDRTGRELFGVTDEPVIEFERKIPRVGGWYIVLDTYNKVNNRRVAIQAKYRILRSRQSEMETPS